MCLRRVDRARETPSFRVDRRRGGGARRLRDRAGLHAAGGRESRHVPRPGGDAPWWEVFRDPVLRDLIHEALRNNYDVRIAAARVQEARAGFVATRSDLFPSLNYDASVGRSNATPGLLGKPGGQALATSNFYS